MRGGTAALLHRKGYTMFDLIFWTVILIINTYFGIDDIRKKKAANWRVALTWAAVGVSWLMFLKTVSLLF
jgi:hypothetical protein